MLDALTALILILIVSSAILSLQFSRTARTESEEFTKLHYVSEDVLDVLNKHGVLDEVATLWAENSTAGSQQMMNASNLSDTYLSKLVPDKVGYMLIVEGDTVTNSSWEPNRVTEASATTKTHSTRLLVGYARGLPTRGLVARASLSNIKEKVSSSFLYFGGFVGQGNISTEMFLPSDISIVEAYMELNTGNAFRLYINNQPCGGLYTPSGGGMAANIEQDISACSGLIDERGDTSPNIFSINFTGSNISNQYVGGGYIEVKYNTSQMNTVPDTGHVRFYFPSISGLINYYSSVYVPGWVTAMESNITFYNNHTTFFYIGDRMIFVTNKSASVQTVGNTSTQLLNLLGASGVSEKTVPIRLGTGGISYNLSLGSGTADVVLITDLSGSMRWRIGYNDSTDGTQRACNAAALYTNDTRRVSLAKCLDADFVDAILNVSGNRVGLVGFNENANSYYLPLTDDRASLITEINTYPDPPSGGTCVCCAINRAISLLQQGVAVIPAGSGNWKYRTYSGCGDSCDPTTTTVGCTPSGWQTEGFSDSAWATTTLPTSATNLQNRVYYFRKHFTLPAEVTGSGNLSIRNRRGVECYLNNHSIGSDTSCATETYWNHVWTVPASYFNAPGTDNVLACRVRSGSAASRRGIVFDAQLMVPSGNKKYIVVMTDGVTGYSCGGCTYSSPCTCSGSCASTTGTYECDGNPPDCSGPQCDTAIGDAICAARRAQNTLNVTVHSVGFGPISSGCVNANTTLIGIAACGNGTYYGSQNASELANIYRDISSDIVNATYSSQTLVLMSGATTAVANAKLYGYSRSYIDFTYIPTDVEAYGMISITQKSAPFNDPSGCVGHVTIPSGVNVSSMQVTSYSGPFWTDYLKVNNSANSLEAYKLWTQYPAVPYPFLGDPYTINVPNPLNVVRSGMVNDLTIQTGKSGTDRTNCSADDRAIYTLRVKSLIGYGGVFSKSEGCSWDIEFEDGSQMNDTMIPSTYAGNASCSYTSALRGGYEDDAVNDAVYRLLSGLDMDQNGKVDIIFDPSAVEFQTTSTGGVRSLWGPVAIKLIVWM